jgi:hypothetical protein
MEAMRMLEVTPNKREAESACKHEKQVVYKNKIK